MQTKKTLEPRNCKKCGTLFLPPLRNRQLFCGLSCQKLFHKESQRLPKELKKGRYEIDNLLKRRPNLVSNDFNLELLDFLKECKRKSYYLDAVDSFRLIHYFVELFDIWHFKGLLIEEELHFYLVKLTKYIKKEFDLQEI
jgi:hypothetical protein